MSTGCYNEDAVLRKNHFQSFPPAKWIIIFLFAGCVVLVHHCVWLSFIPRNLVFSCETLCIEQVSRIYLSTPLLQVAFHLLSFHSSVMGWPSGENSVFWWWLLPLQRAYHKSYDLILFTCALEHLAVFNTGIAIFLRQTPLEQFFLSGHLGRAVLIWIGNSLYWAAIAELVAVAFRCQLLFPTWFPYILQHRALRKFFFWAWSKFG